MPILNNFPSPYGMGYPVGTPTNGTIQNNFPSPYSMGYAPGTPTNGSIQNNFPSPYSMGYDPSVPLNGRITNNYYSPYSMGYGQNAQGVTVPMAPSASNPGVGNAPVSNLFFDPSEQVAGTTPLSSAQSGSNLVSTTPNPNTGYISGLPTAQPDLASITDLVNKLNLQGQQQANAGRIPGATGLEQQSSNNIASLLSGNIPSDVVRNLTQNAAERGIAMGSPGGPNANANLLQSLGLTSLGLQQQGQANLTSALGRNPAAPIFDPTTQLLTPAQKLAAEQRANELGLEWWKALYGNRGGTSGRGTGGGGGQPTGTGGSDWFGNALRTAMGGYGTPSPQYPGPIKYNDPYGGFNPEWPSDTSGDIFGGIIPGTEGPMGPFDPYGGYNPENPDFGTSINDWYGAGYDPFASYDSSGGDFYGGFNPENPEG